MGNPKAEYLCENCGQKFRHKQEEAEVEINPAAARVACPHCGSIKVKPFVQDERVGAAIARSQSRRKSHRPLFSTVVLAVILLGIIVVLIGVVTSSPLNLLFKRGFVELVSIIVVGAAVVVVVGFMSLVRAAAGRLGVQYH